ncbi:MAG: class I SAM-dependent methyltransferase [Acidobacteria bacterium]|nr:class I SAM-dependent methyltransferase [Acidobacteriota bacterium]
MRSAICDLRFAVDVRGSNAEMTERTAGCLLCGSGRFSFLLTASDRWQAREEDFTYVRCDGCGLVGLSPLPSPEEIPHFYPDDYPPHRDPSPWNRDKLARRLAIRYFYGVDSTTHSPLMRSIFRLLSGRVLRDLCEPRGAARLLDVGCGSGGLLAQHSTLGWSVYGIESDPRACLVCRAAGLPVHQGTLFDAPLNGRQFDVILFSHVIEHLLDPVSALTRAARLLAAGGRIVVRTPNVQGLGFSLYRSCWRPLEAPRHIFLFDPKTIRLLAARVGLACCRVTTRPETNMLCESRHCARTQGARLPAGLERRRTLLEGSRKVPSSYKTYRRLMSPVALLFSLAGRGDTLLAEFSLPHVALAGR